MGGEDARRGFNFQDLATAYYFVRDEKAEVLRIEKDIDFSYYIRNSDDKIDHYYQVKSQIQDHLTWSKFKSEVVPSMTDIIKETKTEDDLVSVYHLVADCNLQSNLREVVEEAEKFKKKEIPWAMFKARVGREKIKRLCNEAGLSEGDAQVLFSTFSYHHLTEEQMEEGLLNYLESCNPGRYTVAKEKILNKISTASSARYSRREIEDDIGFDLKKRDNSVSREIGADELRRNIDRIQSKYEKISEGSIGDLEKERKMSEIYVDRVKNNVKERSKEIDLESRKMGVDEGFSEFKKIKKKRSSVANSIASDLTEVKRQDPKSSDDDGE